jgi:hypothetical protein
MERNAAFRPRATGAASHARGLTALLALILLAAVIAPIGWTVQVECGSLLSNPLSIVGWLTGQC